MKILRSNFIAHAGEIAWIRITLDPTKYGWQRVNTIEPRWYEESNLPTNEEYCAHINSKDNANLDIRDTDFKQRIGI